MKKSTESIINHISHFLDFCEEKGLSINTQKNYKIILEPNLNYGRADLGIYLEHKKPIYIEIGTVSLFKLWYNFSTMEGTTFLVVPSENNLIEFNI